MDKEAFVFEDEMNKLDEITAKIKDKNLSIEESSRLYEEAMDIYEKCSNYLKDKELKINLISKDMDN